MGVRPYEPSDLSAVAALDHACFSDFWSEKNWQGTMETPQYACFLLEEADQMAGFILISIVGDEGELLKMGVLPEYRRRGFGAVLLRRAIACWKEEGVESVFLEARESNISARTLYETHDFKEIGVRKNYYDGPKEHAVLYQRII